jgi:ubiquitin-like-conjugating enzyme ATG3
MKKVIEKMGERAAEEQRKALAERQQQQRESNSGVAAASGGSGAASAGSKELSKGGRRWLGGAIRRVTGSGGEKDKKGEEGVADAPGEAIEESGLQVDFYLVIVRRLSSLPPLAPLGRSCSAVVTPTDGLTSSYAVLQFLKFIASIVPTIEVDSTTAADY